jgi:hypothetical protein
MARRRDDAHVAAGAYFIPTAQKDVEMRRRSRARQWDYRGGRNALVQLLARLVGLFVMGATIVPLAWAFGDTPTARLVWCIIGGGAGLVVYGVVIKVYWRD